MKQEKDRERNTEHRKKSAQTYVHRERKRDIAVATKENANGHD